MRFVTNEYIAGATGGNIGTGNWAISFWGSFSAVNQRFLNKNNATTNGFDMFTNANGWIILFFVGDSSNFSNQTTNMTDNTYRHHLFYYNGSTFEIYYNAVSKAVTPAGTYTGAVSNANNLNIGYSPVFGTTAFSGSLHDVRLYNNISLDGATLAKILYEEKGNDNITEGLVTRAALEFGPDGSTVGVTTNLGSSGGTFAVTNTPTYEALPLGGY